MIKAALATMVLVAIAPVVAVQGYEIPWYNKEVVIRGDQFKAAAIAYADFSKVLDERVARLPSERNMKLAQYLSTIDNFDVEIAKGPGRYVVWITPRFSEEFPDDGDLEDAGATYTIDAKTFAAVEKHYKE